MKAPKIDKTAISPFDDYCDGYGCPGAQGLGYVSVLKVSTGTVKKQMIHYLMVLLLMTKVSVRTHTLVKLTC